MKTLADAPLGKKSPMPAHYDAGLLHPIPRALTRGPLGIEGTLPFSGVDVWTAYEVGFRDARGKPQVAVGVFTIPCETPNLIESKSFKLYLNSLNDERFGSRAEVAARIQADIAPVLWGEAEGPSPSLPPGATALSVQLHPLHELEGQRLGRLEGASLDDLDLPWAGEPADPARQLRVDAGAPPVAEVLRTDLFRALCRVTAQPDWGSVQIAYEGPPIEREGLLRYLLGFRHQQEFHEPVAEQIYWDLLRHCRPTRLGVWLRFVRRGGLDINPWRTSAPGPHPGGARLVRQ